MDLNTYPKPAYTEANLHAYVDHYFHDKVGVLHWNVKSDVVLFDGTQDFPWADYNLNFRPIGGSLQILNRTLIRITINRANRNIPPTVVDIPLLYSPSRGWLATLDDKFFYQEDISKTQGIFLLSEVFDRFWKYLLFHAKVVFP